MANPGVEFIVIDEFDESPGAVEKLALKIDPDRDNNNLDYKVLIPLKIKYKKSKKDTLLKVSANATGNPGLMTFRSFRGQFISPVFDEKSEQNIFSIPHQIDRKNSAKKAYVERCSWEEGKSPQIQIITNREEGVIALHFLAMLGAEEDYPYIDPSVGIEINVDEIIMESGKGQNLGKFEISLDKGANDEFQYEEEVIIRTFQHQSHQIKGQGSCIHPKQLITVDLLESTLNKSTIDFFGSKIDIGYIGLDTGENILSVIRYIDRKGLSNLVTSINIFYEKKWDEGYRKRLAPTIEDSGIDINWIEINSADISEYKVDFMISTYVAVWAANEEKIETAQHEDYFKNAYEWCKEKALLISIDPVDPGKIARSHRHTSSIDVTAYYTRVGFKQIDEFLVPGENSTCKDSVWKKGTWEYEISQGVRKEEITQTDLANFDNLSSRYTPTVSNELTSFIEETAGYIECAGIPTDAAKLVLGDVLNSKNTKMVNSDNWGDGKDKLGMIRAANNDLRFPIYVEKSTKKDFEKKPDNIWKCDTHFVRFDCPIDETIAKQNFSFDLQAFKSKIASQFESGLLEVPLSIYSPIPVVISGDPGYGKSVRMKQIAAEISANQSISQFPIFVKAKHLADYVDDLGVEDFIADSPSYEACADIISKAFIDSSPLSIKFDLSVEKTRENLIEICHKSEFDSDAGIVLIVDAIDEIVDENKVDSVLQWLDWFGRNFGAGNSRCVISTRPSHQDFLDQVFSGFSLFEMYFNKQTLQHIFPYRLVDAWRMSDNISQDVSNLISNNNIFDHIDRPLLLGWLCRFVRDGIDLGNLENSYNFYEKILDQAINTTRFRSTNYLSKNQIVSAKKMRDFIAFVDLLGIAREHIGTIELTSRKNRLQLLSLRNSGFFPGLQELDDEDAHRLFFEDLSLIFVSGTGEIAWTHEHLKEYAAALFLHSDSLIPTEIFDLLGPYGITDNNYSYDHLVHRLLTPLRPYFSEALNYLIYTNSQMAEYFVVDESKGPISTTKNLSNLEVLLYRLSYDISEKDSIVGPDRFVRITDEFDSNDIKIDEENKIMLKEVIVFFCNQSIDWLISGNLNTSRRNYIELITGGFIPELAQIMFSDQERIKLFSPIFGETPAKSKSNYNEVELRGLFFSKFINLQGDENEQTVSKYVDLLKINLDNKKQFIQKNKLELDYELYYYFTHYYNPKSKKSDSVNHQFFKKFNRLVKPTGFEDYTYGKWKNKVMSFNRDDDFQKQIDNIRNWYNEADRIQDKSEKGKVLTILLKLLSEDEKAELDENTLPYVVRMIFNEVSNLENIQQYLDIVERVIVRLNDTQLLIRFYMYVGPQLNTKKFWNEGEDYFLKALDLCRDIYDYDSQLTIINKLIGILRNQGKPKNNFNKLKSELIEKMQREGLRPSEKTIQDSRRLVHYYEKNGNYEDSKYNLEIWMKAAQESNDQEEILKSLQSLWHIEKKFGTTSSKIEALKRLNKEAIIQGDKSMIGYSKHKIRVLERQLRPQPSQNEMSSRVNPVKRPSFQIPSFGKVRDILNMQLPIMFNILEMTFFFDEREMAKLIKSYFSNDVRNPIHVTLMEQEDVYTIVDGRRRLIVLCTALIEANRRTDNREDRKYLVDNVLYKDNTDTGSLGYMIENHLDYGEDFSSFVKNINVIIDAIENNGKLTDFYETVSTNDIRWTLINPKQTACKECGSIEFETREDGDRYCKSCGALDEDSLYDFGPED